MTATYENINTTTLSSAASTITFNSISSAYTDLRIILTTTGDATASGWNVRYRFNSDTGSNYSTTGLRGDGAAADSFSTTSATSISLVTGLSTTIPYFYQIDVFSYAGSTNKTTLNTISADRNGAGQTVRVVGLWRNTAAITRIDLSPVAGNFIAGTTATLFGIKAE